MLVGGGGGGGGGADYYPKSVVLCPVYYRF